MPNNSCKLEGKKFSSLEVIKKLGKDKRGSFLWLCKCVCGKETILRSSTINGGTIKSCWCSWHRNRSHGMTHKRIYKIRRGIKNRCNNPKRNIYMYYGWRGITYDKKRECFENFYADMWPTYKEYLELDRIDNDGNYCKENCRRVTHKENCNNKWKETIVDTRLIPELMEKYKLSYHCIYNRIKKWIQMESEKKTRKNKF